jgi:sugar/nucleoside kinase (ribokinase family)
MAAAFDVVGVGNAIVDVLAPVTDAFLLEQAIPKGAMNLIEEDRADALTALFQNSRIIPGGSGANTLAGVASLGGRGGYIGKVGADDLGALFARDFNAGGVAFDTPAHAGGPGTARCLIAVTPDGQRSMSTFLGCSTLLDERDLDRDRLASAAIVFLEGYLFDREEAKRAFVHAAEIAASNGRKTALTLSDLFCVDRHRESFRHLVKHHTDILFANEAEIMALYEVETFEEAVATVRAECETVALTRSEKGSVVMRGGEIVSVPAAPVAQVIDTTGAGDLYAAGFLYGLATGRELAACGALGSLAAAEVISHWGPRPEVSLAALAAERGL